MLSGSCGYGRGGGGLERHPAADKGGEKCRDRCRDATFLFWLESVPESGGREGQAERVKPSRKRAAYSHCWLVAGPGSEGYRNWMVPQRTVDGPAVDPQVGLAPQAANKMVGVPRPGDQGKARTSELHNYWFVVHHGHSFIRLFSKRSESSHPSQVRDRGTEKRRRGPGHVAEPRWHSGNQKITHISQTSIASHSYH